MDAHSEVMTLWHAAGNNVLSVLLGVPGAHEEALRRQLRAEHFPPGSWRDVFPALMDLRLHNQEVVATTVVNQAAALGHQVDLYWVEMQMARLDDLQVDSFEENLGILIEQAEIDHDNGVYANAQRRLQAGHRREEVAAWVTTSVSTRTGRDTRDATASAGADRVAALLDDEPRRVIPTGIPFIDQRTYGVQRGQTWAVVAHYKGWKSRVMRNLALNVCANGGSTTLGLFEGTQDQIEVQFVAMLAARWLWHKGWFEEKDNHGQPLCAIDPLYLHTFRKVARQQWPQKKLQALDAGLQAYADLGDRLRVYDKTKHGGHLFDFGSVLAMLLRDQHLYGDVDLLALDFLQLIEVPDAQGIYDRVSFLAPALQSLAIEQDVCVLLLSQQSEQEIRSKRTSHSPGAKGGGDLPAAADFLFTTEYNAKDSEGVRDQLKLCLRLSRYAQAGPDVYTYLPVEAVTGWIIEHELKNVDRMVDQALESGDEEGDAFDALDGIYDF